MSSKHDTGGGTAAEQGSVYADNVLAAVGEQLVLVYITASSLPEAERIAEEIVGVGLAACANILPAMVSIYRWQNELKRDDEVTLLLKTRASHVKRITERVIALHSYDCPCVVALPIVSGSSEFMRWIAEQTG